MNRAILVLCLMACDRDAEPTCADWLLCYEECRANNLEAPGSLNGCLVDCPSSYVANPALGVPQVEWADSVLEQAVVTGGPVDETKEALVATVAARGECLAWRN